MKRIIAVLFFGVILFSCSSDDNPESPQQQQFMFFPLSANSYWTFDNDSEAGVSRDSIYVEGTQLLNNKTFTNLDALPPVTGFMTQLVVDNLVHYTGSQLLVDGALSSPIIDGFPALSIDLDEFILLDADVSTPGTILSSISGEITEVIMDIPLVFDYELKSVHSSLTTSGTGNGSIETKLVLTLSVAAEINVAGIIISIPVLASQDVMVATNTFAENIGLEASNILIEYELEDLSGTGIEIPIPSQGTSTATQQLDAYFIGS